jgi:hypothetical protein
LGRLGGAVDADPAKAETVVDPGDRIVAAEGKTVSAARPPASSTSNAVTAAPKP